MNIYTDKEKSSLYDKIVSLFEVEHTGSLGAYYDESLQYAYVVIQGEFCKIQTQILLNIVFYDRNKTPDLYKMLNSSFSGLHTLINFGPVTRVPLYIHDIPDVANWRLEIGK